MHYKNFLSCSPPQSLPKAVQRKKAPSGKSTWVAISCSAARWELWLRPSTRTTLLVSSADLWGQNGEILRQPRKQNMKVNSSQVQLSQLSKREGGDIFQECTLLFLPLTLELRELSPLVPIQLFEYQPYLTEQILPLTWASDLGVIFFISPNFLHFLFKNLWLCSVIESHKLFMCWVGEWLYKGCYV